jgi:hypothetical protein
MSKRKQGVCKRCGRRVAVSRYSGVGGWGPFYWKAYPHNCEGGVRRDGERARLSLIEEEAHDAW